MSILAEKIDSIILSRIPIYKKCLLVEENLINLNNILNQFSSFINILPDKFELDKRTSIASNKITQNLLPSIKKLQARFSRKTINIGVVGMAGQGKSTLLQQLTGLTSTEIPSGSKGHCTGVKSIIENQDAHDAYAIINFYSKDEFLNDVLRPYYKELNLEYLESLETFELKSLPPLKHENTSSMNEAKYEKLKELKQNYPFYKNILNTSAKRVERAKIREYVAQDNLTGERIYNNYLAVKVANILCKYPKTEISKIALCDTPGLGDTGVGAQDRLIDSLSKDVDFILFLKLPSQFRAIWSKFDIELYDLSCKAIKELPLNEWSLFVLNKNENNNENCQLLKSTIKEHKIDTIDCLISDCSNTEEANLILERILSELSKNLNKLDLKYSSLINDQLNELKNEIESIVQETKKVLENVSISSNSTIIFNGLFEKFWEEQLTVSIQNLVDELSIIRNDEDSSFLNNINEVLERCKEEVKLPLEEEMSNLAKARNNSLETAYHEYLTRIRADLSRQFLDIDDGLIESANIMRQKIGQCLRNTDLKNIFELTPEDEVVKIMFNKIDSCTENVDKLSYAFEIIKNFNLAFRGFVQHRIRKQLDLLDPKTTDKELQNSINNAKQAVNATKSLFEETLNKCRDALKDIANEPNMAHFAIVEEFKDRSIRAEGLKQEWFAFMEELKSDLWSEKFQKLEENTKNRKMFYNYVEKFIELSNKLVLE